MVRRVLELGAYIAPSYAGMLLAEQGYSVTKWWAESDPLFKLLDSDKLWSWLTYRKNLVQRHASEVLDPTLWSNNPPDIILDNFRPATLEKWGVDPTAIAQEKGIVWVSLRADVGDTSLDMVAQARSWMEYVPWIPFYLGDTSAGLWMAFKAIAASNPGHYPIGQASCLQKMVEGELLFSQTFPPRETPPETEAWQPSWDGEEYWFDGQTTQIAYKDRRIEEPVRDHNWKLKHLWHQCGRITI